MSDIENDSSDEWLECTLPDIKEETKITPHHLLPSKSRHLYESTYDAFVKWKQENKTKLTSESIVITYFTELSEKYKPSTLWNIYSMLKATLKFYENIVIDNYDKLKEFLKKQSSGFKSKTTNVLSSNDIDKFLAEAPDYEYLATKTALIFGISGGCRSNELVNIKMEHITMQGDILVVDLPATKTKKARTFVVTKEFTKVVKKYMDLRPKTVITDRFFLNLQKGKCTAQVIGRHKFAQMPKQIATYLKLKDPDSYTGHAFRRTSATLTADSRVNVTFLKNHSRWKSSTVAKRIEESIDDKSKIARVISASEYCASAEASTRNTNSPLPKSAKIDTIAYEKIISDALSRSNGEKTSSAVFNNCSFIIHHNFEK